ncbi:MAG: hypothetical protein OXE98_00980 [Hyphomicrobiales bacterium]|nr:hypothetical protein [Hyphomicrobiales bacterium]
MRILLSLVFAAILISDANAQSPILLKALTGDKSAKLIVCSEMWPPHKRSRTEKNIWKIFECSKYFDDEGNYIEEGEVSGLRKFLDRNRNNNKN